MKQFRFTIARDATESATITVTAETIDEAHDIATGQGTGMDPATSDAVIGSVVFERDDCSESKIYLPDDSNWEEVIPGGKDFCEDCGSYNIGWDAYVDSGGNVCAGPYDNALCMDCGSEQIVKKTNQEDK